MSPALALDTAPPPDPKDVSADSNPESDEVESPSVSTPSARARFEFETGRGNHDGTKVLMVEWEDDDVTRTIPGRWAVSWEGKPPMALQAEEKSAAGNTTSEKSRQTSHRMYFLLGAAKSIPATVTLTLHPFDPTAHKPVEWRTNPLPAIFPPSLTNAATQGGTINKGVLHTLWATKRLSTLEQEIEHEAQQNCEGIGLQMALGEREWIMSNFGIDDGRNGEFNANGAPSLPQLLTRVPGLHGDTASPPGSPLSPGGSKLSEKLRGLKLQTPSSARQPEDEVAVPLCQRKREKLAAGTNASERLPQRRPTAPAPSGMSSIGSVLADQGATAPHEEEEELFALPLSPRSPDMTKSPFSFAADDTRRYLLGAQRVQ